MRACGEGEGIKLQAEGSQIRPKKRRDEAHRSISLVGLGPPFSIAAKYLTFFWKACRGA